MNPKQYVQYCSVGIDDKCRLVPFPILTKLVTIRIDGEECKPKFHVQSTEEAATERDLTLLLIGDLYELDAYGFSDDIMGRWFVNDEGSVYARDMNEANEAILEIRSRFETKKEIKRVQPNQQVRGDDYEDERDRRIG